MIFQPLRRLSQSLTEFRGVYPDAPLLSFHVFLTITINQGIRTQELVDMLGSTQSTISRHQQILQDGFGLIELVVNPDDRRSRLSYLTMKGRLLAVGLARICDPSTEVSVADFDAQREKNGGGLQMT